jgi:hypothetical protein
MCIPAVILWVLAYLLVSAPLAFARPVQVHELTTDDDVDRVGGAAVRVSKAVGDTIWIADWSFDPGCTNAFSDAWTAGEQVPGWLRSDNRILSDGNVYWHVRDSFAGALVDTLGAGAGDDAFITGNAAVLTHHDLCWGFPDGYGSSWYQAICIRYVGDSLLDFDVLVDTEEGFDFLLVQTDSACASASRLDYSIDPNGTRSDFIEDVETVSGLVGVHYEDIALDAYGTADTHCVYIGFREDGAFSQEDGLQPTVNAAALVVDNIVVSGAYPSAEDWDGGGSGANGDYEFVNLQDAEPFGMWMRVFRNISDNDACTSNTTCAWLDTDHTTPTVANVQAQAFAPNSFVIKNWKETAVHSPWVSLATTPDAVGTVLTFRRFGGNFFNTSRAVHNWSVRSKIRIENTDSPAPDDSLDCVLNWSHAFQNNSLSSYTWVTLLFDMSQNVAPGAREVQLRFRNRDWQFVANATPPVPFQPGPGPFLDRVRIGRRVLTGPAISQGIDARTQAQDGAPTNGNETGAFPAPDYAQDPAGDIFGTTAFSRSGDLGINGQTANLVLGDSITILSTDVRQAGGITSVNWYGAIVRGPHAGKAPPPYTVGANGFFCVPADTAYNGTLPSPGTWAVDVDDTYFRGGDEVRCFWFATDVQGGSASWPFGMSAEPVDLAEAESLTGGLLEFSALPAIAWDPAYLAAIAADAHGDVAPTPEQIASSTQVNCILYYNHVNQMRLSGDANRTSFMQTLDQLGYKGYYDVYDHQGLGNTNNALGSRMTVAQARYYAILIMDAGNRSPGAPIIPDGVDIDSEKIDMDAWLTSWLQTVGQGTALPNHTLWLIGKDWAEEGKGVQLGAQARVAFVAPDDATSPNPIAVGQQSQAMVQGCPVNSPLVSWSLVGGCPVGDYDVIAPLGVAVETHTYDNDGTAPIAAPGMGKGAIVMHADAAFGSNTIMQTHAWSDIRDFGPPGSPEPEEAFLAQVLNCVLPVDCRMTPDEQVDVPGEESTSAIPARTALHPNVPNPFNPTTTIRFDLSRPGRVSLRLYDVAGRLVRTLVDADMPPGRHAVTWSGLDESGGPVSSGVYFYRLVAANTDMTRKMVLMK